MPRSYSKKPKVETWEERSKLTFWEGVFMVLFIGALMAVGLWLGMQHG